ncbi:MAG: hypothetical protein IAG13_24255, partial [Deltaproteobacteria bacterium]|nr:hypothetical protein [Nannocystaceae bacterium]
APAPLRAWVRARAPLLVLIAIAGVLLWPLVCGEPPASRDHAIHYFQARILVDEMLPSGRLSGWTDRLNHGFPYGEGYPTLGYLWVSAVHLLGFGVVDLRASYAWGLLGVWALSLWGVWQLAALVTRDVLERWQGEADDPERHRIAAWAGCAAALAWLLDPGAARQGGWNYLMFHGVWPQLLSVALWVASLVAIAWCSRAPSLRRIAIAAVLVAGGLLAHPFGLLTTACSALSFAIVMAVADDARTRPGRFRVLVAIHALGVALAFGGLATFLAAAGEMGRSPVAWSELGELAAKLATGDLFTGTWVYAGAFAVIGLGLALWSGRTVAWVCASTAIGMLVLASQDAITVLRLDLLTAAFKNLQFPRFAIALKPFVFAFAGVGVTVVLRAAWTSWATRATSVRRVHRVFVAIVLAPVLGAMLGRLDLFARRPIGAIDTLADSGHADDELALREALQAEASTTAELRVAFLRSGMGGGTYPLFSIADAGGAAVLDGHVPTVNFVYNVERRAPPVLRRLGVTHVIHDLPLPDEEGALASYLTPLGVFGPYSLSRLDLPVESGPRFARGTGSFRELERGPQSLVLEVETNGAELSLSRAPSERWQWTLDGEPLEPIIGSVPGGGIDLLGVELLHGGRLELGWAMGELERRGPWISAVAALLTMLALGFGRPLRWRTRAHDRNTVLIARMVLAAVFVLLVFGVLRRQRHQLAVTWNEYAAERAARHGARALELELVDDLGITGEVAVEASDRRMCDGLLGRDVLDDCEKGDHLPHLSFVFVEPYIYRCTSFGVAPGQTVTVRLGEPGDEILAFVQRQRVDASRRDMRFSWGGAFTVLGNRRAELHLKPKQHPGGAELQLVNDGGEVEDVCIGAGRFR